MKERLVVLFAFVSIVAIFLSVFKDHTTVLNDKISNLKRELDTVTKAQHETRSLFEDNSKLVGEIKNDLDKKFTANDQKNEVNKGEILKLKSQVNVNIDVLYNDILIPSVQVEYGTNVGGGTVIYVEKLSSGNYETLILTAHHVIKKAIKKENDKEKLDEVIIRIFGKGADSLKEFKSQIASYDKVKDVALLIITTKEQIVHPVKLASKANLRNIKIFTPVYTVGCPLGHDPFPTGGAISSLNKQVSGETLWIMTAPTIFGNSGGGVFLKETHELIGITSMICTFDNLVSTPVYHMSILLPLDKVYDWLSSIGYEHVYNPSAKDKLKFGGVAKTNY